MGKSWKKAQRKHMRAHEEYKHRLKLSQWSRMFHINQMKNTLSKYIVVAFIKSSKGLLQKTDWKTFHDLRHLNASVMLALGVPDKYAMERGGWSSNNVLKSVYQHTFSTERKQVDDRIDRYFRDAFEKTTSKWCNMKCNIKNKNKRICSLFSEII